MIAAIVGHLRDKAEVAGSAPKAHPPLAETPAASMKSHTSQIAYLKSQIK